MYTYEKIMKLSNQLESIAEDLDIPASLFLEAKKRYESIGDWLGKDGSSLAIYGPEIYPQGSFRLGTVVKPISNKDEYDIDLVCYLDKLSEEEISQQELKNMVGNRLKENETYKRLLDEEGRRCWTLKYANEFHMDILPAIPDENLRSQNGFYKDAILITDKKKIENGDLDWPKSNPKGYAEWFHGRQIKIFQELREKIAEREFADIEDIPDYRVKTPLQIAIQILKRHRDIYFFRKQGNEKPISIIITTISAKIYNGQNNVFNAIHDILMGIKKDLFMEEGSFYVRNPVNREENFADKWDENPELPRAFFEWIENARKTFCETVLDFKEGFETKQILNEHLGIKTNTEKSSSALSSIAAPTYVTVKSNQKENKPWKRK